MPNQSDFKPGTKWRVTRPGATLHGMKPAGPYAQQGWREVLEVGTILTVNRTSMSFGDGVPIVKWLDAGGKWIANDCEFSPSTGGMWHQVPDLRYLTPWSPEIEAWFTYNGALDHRDHFEASVRFAWIEAEAVQLIARAAEHQGQWVLWDPEANPDGFMLVGDDPYALAREAVDHLELEVP